MYAAVAKAENVQTGTQFIVMQSAAMPTQQFHSTNVIWQQLYALLIANNNHIKLLLYCYNTENIKS